MEHDAVPTIVPHPIEWTDAAIARLWDYYGSTASLGEIYFADQYGDRMLQLSGLPLRESIRVLDFGCGPGFIWNHVVALGANWEYMGLDFSSASVSRLRESAHGHPQFQGAFAVDALPTSLAGGTFDAVLLLEVVEHLNDVQLDSTLNEIYRLLMPGGTLVVTAPNDEDLANCTKFCPDCGAVFHEWQHVRSWTKESLAHRFRQSGFRLKNVRTLDFGARGVKRQLINLARKTLLGLRVDPHMIATFEKR